MSGVGAAGVVTNEARGAAPGKLTGAWLIAARSVWLALVIPSLALFAASLPVYDALIQRPCAEPNACNLAGALTAAGLAQLPSLGLTPGSYALLLITTFVLVSAIWAVIGFLIFWRRSDEWFPLLIAFFLITFNVTYPGFPISALALEAPWLNALTTALGALGLASLAVFLALFPSGKLIPRWILLFVILAILSTISTLIPPTSRFSSANIPGWLIGVMNLVTFVPIMGAQVYRYRRVSTAIERQQTKWVVVGIVTVLAFVFFVVPIGVGGAPAQFNAPNTPISQLFGLLIYPIVLLALPITVGIAILRFHLYDIDVLIKRTLVYGILIAALALVYFALVIGLASLARLITGQQGQSQLVIVLSTLAIAALFEPLRRRIRQTIDRRFYRRGYDAARAIGAFSATLRNEVDLRQLNEHLLAVVEETMQPASLSLWLRPLAEKSGRGARSAEAAPQEAKEPVA